MTGELDALIGQIAAATCTAIQNCCNETELDLYFGPISFNPYLEDLKDQLPPMADFDANTCVGLLTTAYQVVPFGPWISAVEGGYAEYDADAAAACLAEMESAQCGQPFADVMFSGRCFGFSPPSGDDAARRAFRQTGTAGDACVGLNDGVGGGFFGTCNPMMAVCAFEDEEGRRRLTSVERAEVGTCVPARNENESCSLPDFNICRRGLSCVNDVCVPPITTPLNVGDTCYEGFEIQGECQNSYCDIFGQPSVCVAKKELEASCSSSEECASNFCEDGQCATGAFCDGE